MEAGGTQKERGFCLEWSQGTSYWVTMPQQGWARHLCLHVASSPSCSRMFRILQGGYLCPEEEARFGAISRGTAELAPKARSPESKAQGLAAECNLAPEGLGLKCPSC